LHVIVDLYFTRFHRFRGSDDPSTQEHSIRSFFSSAPTSCKLLSTFPMCFGSLNVASLFSDYKPHMFKHKMVTLSALRIDK